MTAPFETADKIRCLEREIALRKRVYPNRILTHRMRKEAADREIALMQAILEDYRKVTERI